MAEETCPGCVRLEELHKKYRTPRGREKNEHGHYPGCRLDEKGNLEWALLEVLRSHRYEIHLSGINPDDPGWHPCSCGIFEGYWSGWHPHIAKELRKAVEDQALNQAVLTAVQTVGDDN